MRLRLSLHTAAMPFALVAFTAATASAQVEYAFTGLQLDQIVVNGIAIPASDLKTGLSTGLVSNFGGTEGAITAADDLDATTYFARGNVQPDLWGVEFAEPWSDASAGEPDFFLIEAGGNDVLEIAPVLPSGPGQRKDFGQWVDLGLQTSGGPNDGQPLRVLEISGTDLLDADGSPLDDQDVVTGLEIYSSSVDGAVLTWREGLPTTLAERVRPEVIASPDHIPLGDGNQTVVTLSAKLPNVPVDTKLSYVWIVPGATYVNGTSFTSAEPEVTFSGDLPAYAELTVVPVGNPVFLGKDRFSIGLDLPGAVELHGSPTAAQKVELWFDGPWGNILAETPNPFLDRRLDVTFTRPDGSQMVVPGFFDADGRGKEIGRVWKARLTPDQAGTWSFTASFRSGTDIAIADDPTVGTPISFDGTSGSFDVAPRDPLGRGFTRRGHLRYVGEHYRRFDDGTYFIKGGTNSPENLLAFRGFDGVLDSNGQDGLHEYAPHQSDWSVFDPDLPRGDWDGDRGLIGALNYLESVGVNNIYFLPMNLGGDGQDTFPFVGDAKNAFDKTHYATLRLLQWETVFWEATLRGIQLHVVLAETESSNMMWLDDGLLGPERKLYLREMVARFSHHLALKWNLSEENVFSDGLIAEMASYLDALDPYDHPIGFHVYPNQINDYIPFYANPDLNAASVQYTPSLAGFLAESVRADSISAGQKWVVDLDENTPAEVGLTDLNAAELRKESLYDILFSGGQIEWYAGYHPLPLGGDLNLEDFRTREEMWTYTRLARQALATLPFWRMEPRDDLLLGEFIGPYGEAEVFAEVGSAYAIYIPDARFGTRLDLTSEVGPFELRWFNPRTGEYTFMGAAPAGGLVSLGLPPSELEEDWVAIVRRPTLWTEQTVVSVSQSPIIELNLDAGPLAAGTVYLMAGSLSGTAPGFPLASGASLPLNLDAYLLQTTVGPSPILNPLGFLDDTGRAQAGLFLPPDPALAGLSISHAWIADPLGIQVPSKAVTTITVP